MRQGGEGGGLGAEVWIVIRPALADEGLVRSGAGLMVWARDGGMGG